MLIDTLETFFYPTEHGYHFKEKIELKLGTCEIADKY